MSTPVISMNYTMNRSSKNITSSSLSRGSSMFMPFNSLNNNTRTVIGLEIKPSKAYKGCGSCGRG